MIQEPACIILRVSTSRQREDLQGPDTSRWCEDRNYDVRQVFRLRGKSAFKGEQQEALNKIIQGAGKDWTVVVVASLDRIERRGVEELWTWLGDLRRAGARLESTSKGEEWLGDQRDAMWFIRLTMEGDRAKRESELRKERTARGHVKKDELGQGRVKLPLGWTYENHGKFDSRIVVDPDAMAAVREAFKRAANGETLQMISRAMKKMGYPRTPEAISTLLRMPCYVTGELLVPVLVKVERAVTPQVQAQAVAALEARRTYDGPRTKDYGSKDFGGRIFCYRHLQPLHRWSGPVRKDGTRAGYYRARRRDGGECGCGLFKADDVDDLVNTLGWMQDEPETEMLVTGDSSVRLAQIEQEMNRIHKDRRKIPGWLAEMAELEAEEKALQNAPGGWERRETGRTLGDVWKTMGIDGKRRYLERQTETRNWRILVRKVDLGGKRYVKASVKRFGLEYAGPLPEPEDR